MAVPLRGTELWRDAEGLPDALAATLDRSDGFDDVVALLGRGRRVVATGNGASYYVALGLWLASLESERRPVEVLAVPAGLVALGAFPWREGDVLLAISSSGELRDVIEAVEGGAPRPFALVTATPDSTLGREAGARALVTVTRQRSRTHTQGYCGALLACLEIWRRLADDATLGPPLGMAPRWAQAALLAGEDTRSFLDDAGIGLPRGGIVVASGAAWPAALEAALLLKEVALLPFEGHEAREGGTTGMYAIGPGQLAVGLTVGDDPLVAEALDTCAARGAEWRTHDAGEDRRLAPVSTFPGMLALAVELALAQGLDPDAPPWAAAYDSTVRR